MKLSVREKYSYGIGALGKDMICGVILPMQWSILQMY